MRSWLPGLLLGFLLAAGRVHAQDPTQCTGVKNSDGLTFEDSGGAGAFSGTVTTACGALTSANTNDSWITITSATTFSIQFTVAPNATPSSRSGSVTAIFGSAPGGPVSFIFTLTQFAKLSLASSSLPTGAVGLPYSVQLPVTGGSNFSRSFSITSGALPAGLGINGPNIGGTPTAPGAPSFTVQVRDVDPTTGTPFFATQSYTLTINPRFALSTTSLPGATVGVAYSAAVAANGGIPPYAWSLSSGALPQMLSLDPNSGAISGTPNANTQGTYPLTIQVTDQANEVLTGPLTLHVAGPALTISTSSLSPATEGLAYSAALGASGGTPPYSWSGTNLPAWLHVSSTGQLSGTPPSGSAGNYSFNVSVQDSNSQSTGAPLSLQVNPAPLVIVTTSPLTDGKEGSAYHASFQASGGKGSYTWTATGLPAFLNLAAGGILSGTPPVGSAGLFSFSVSVSDTSGNKTGGTFSLKVDSQSSPNPLTITTSALSPATEGIVYSAALGASGGTPPYSWSGTNLPAWLHVSSTGQLSGTPPPGSAASYSFNVSVQDSNSQSAGVALSLQVNPAPLVIVTTSPLPDGKEGNAYHASFQATGGKGSYTWTSLGLPAFLNLAASGGLSGTPTVGSAGLYSFTVTVSDTSGNKTGGTFSLKVDSQSSPNPLAITTSGLSPATEGIVYSAALGASGGTQPYSWNGTGLPAWLHVSSTGQLSGTPPPGSAGNYSFNVSVQDANSQSTGVPLSLQVNAAPLVIVTTSPLTDGKEGSAYHASFQASGGKGSYTWTASGLPAFLNLSAGGNLSGTPPVGSAGLFSFTLSVSDTSGNKTGGTFSLKVDSQSSPNPLTITTSALSGATEGIVYSTLLGASGGTQPYSWTGTGLPAWLHVSSTGQLSGTPPAGSAASYSFDVKVQDAHSQSTSVALSLQVNPAPLVIVTPASLTDGKEGSAYHTSFQATGGKGSYTWTASGLPAFLNLSARGILSGTPTVGSAGMYSFTVNVSDTSGNKTSGTFSLKVDMQSSSNPLAIVAPLLAPAIEGGPYSATLTANGGTPPYSWTGTGLPSWLHISSTGQLSGTPPPGSSGTYTFTVNVQDANSQSTTITVSLQVNAAALAIATTSPLPDGKEGSAIGVSFQGIGGKSPYTWTAAGLPAFLSLTASGNLSGKPPAASAGTYSITITVTDASGSKTSGTFSITIDPLLSITVTPPVLEATEGQPYSVTFGVSGGTSPYVWSAIGLPSWASLSPGGVLTGTPPAGSAGGAQFTVTATDAKNNADSSQVTLVVLAANGGITITTPSLPDGTVGANYHTTLSATGGTPPYKWTGSGIPDGLTLASNGELSGTPTSPSDSSVTAQVTDASNHVAFAALTLHVASSGGLTIATPRPLPTGEVRIAYSTMFNSSGGTRPQSWSLVSGPLPPGLTLDSSGVLSGTPTESGVFDFTLAVTELGSPKLSLAKKLGGHAKDNAANTATAVYEILVRPYLEPDLVVSCGNLTFDVPSQASASLQTCSLISTIFNTIPFTVSVDAPWLSVSPSGFTPGRIDVSVDSSGLAPGVYTATITLSSPGVAPKTITVTLTVHQSPSGLLQVSPSSLTISSPGSPPVTKSLFLQNTGQGDVTFTASVDVPWLQVTPATGTLSGGATVTLQATALAPTLSPGAYLGNIEIDSSSGTNLIPLKLLISRKPRMILSRDGMLLVARQGNGVSGPAPSTFLIWSDSTDIHYAVEQLGGEGWLTLVSDQHGTATDTIPGTVAFQAKSAGLAKGAYYARLRVTAFEPYNSLLDFLVVLDVEDSSEQPVPDPDPAGLVFAARGAPISAQTVNVYTSSDQPLPYEAAVYTESGGDWLSATPLAGMLSTGTPGQLSVSADASNLKPGIYRGEINISISNLEVRTVNVTLIVPGLSTSPPAAAFRAAATAAASASCTPANLVLTETGSAGNFSTPAGWPGYLAVQLSDNCGNPVLRADVAADFSNGDAPLSLTATDPKMAVYSATWTPMFSTSELTITFHAAAKGLQSATTQLVGGVSDTPYPILSQNSTVNNLYPRSGAPLAPGTIVAIYGSALAPAPTTANGKLPTLLSGTSVFIGGELAPLYYVSGNQINAQLPFDLLPDQEYQLLVLANGGYSTPDTIRIDPATPGVARLANGQVIAQHQDFSPVTPSSAAKPGEYLVIYLAGMGLTDQTIVAGVISPTKPLASVSVPATVTLDGEPVSVLFAGLSPGFVGLYQINFQVPADAKSGALTLQISQMGVAANTSVLVVGK